MIFGLDFKYSIPEMDRLLGAAADLGIHFSYGNEDIANSEENEFVIQVVNVGINGTVIQLMVTSPDFHVRNGGKIIPFPTKEPARTRKNKTTEA